MPTYIETSIEAEFRDGSSNPCDAYEKALVELFQTTEQAVGAIDLPKNYDGTTVLLTKTLSEGASFIVFRYDGLACTSDQTHFTFKALIIDESGSIDLKSRLIEFEKTVKKAKAGKLRATPAKASPYKLLPSSVDGYFDDDSCFPVKLERIGLKNQYKQVIVAVTLVFLGIILVMLNFALEGAVWASTLGLTCIGAAITEGINIAVNYRGKTVFLDANEVAKVGAALISHSRTAALAQDYGSDEIDMHEFAPSSPTRADALLRNSKRKQSELDAGKTPDTGEKDA